MRRIQIVLFIVGIGCIIGGIAQAQDRPLLVVGESFPPFEFEENGEIVGMDVDIVRHIFTRMQINFKVEIYPWKRAWMMIEEGEADAVLSTSRKEAREPYLYYPDEDMWVSEYVFFVRKDHKQPQFNGYEDAKANKLTIGIIRGNSYHDSFWQAFPNQEDGKPHKQLIEAADAERNMLRLAQGNIDLFIIDKTIGRYLVRMLNLKDLISFYDVVLFSKGYPMPFAKKSSYPNLEQIAVQFEQELIKLKESGLYDKIQEKWLE